MGAYREYGRLRTGRMLFVKWTTEGMVKGESFIPSIP